MEWGQTSKPTDDEGNRVKNYLKTEQIQSSHLRSSIITSNYNNNEQFDAAPLLYNTENSDKLQYKSCNDVCSVVKSGRQLSLWYQIKNSLQIHF